MSNDPLHHSLLGRSHVIASVFRQERGIILTSERRRKDSVAEEQLPMRGPLQKERGVSLGLSLSSD